MYEKFLSLRKRISLRILVWGPDPNSSDPAATKRKEIRAVLEREGHKVFFSEELIFDKKYVVPANVQEQIQLWEVDAVVCLGSDIGPIQEAQEFGRYAREFLLWLSDRARERYTALGLGRQLRSQGRAPSFFDSEDLTSCVVAAASSEWVEQRRMKFLSVELERERLDEMFPKRTGFKR